MKFEGLYEISKNTLNPRELSKSFYSCSVKSDILSESGRVYTVVCIDTPCSMVFCVEHGAIADMITVEESRIMKAIPVYEDRIVMP